MTVVAQVFAKMASWSRSSAALGTLSNCSLQKVLNLYHKQNC